MTTVPANDHPLTISPALRCEVTANPDLCLYQMKTLNDVGGCLVVIFLILLVLAIWPNSK